MSDLTDCIVLRVEEVGASAFEASDERLVVIVLAILPGAAAVDMMERVGL